jgi:DnaJ-class molecular chaperone
MADPADSAAIPGPAPCGPCRGTGVVVSGAGGAPQEVPCPWCEGGGTRIEGHDAQAARRTAGGEADAGPSPEVD